MGIGTVIWNTFAEFGVHTTIGGLCNAGLTTSRPRQIYWLVIFFILFAYTIKLLVDNVNQYLQYAVITSTDLAYSSSLAFPALTICNQNRLVLKNLFICSNSLYFLDYNIYFFGRHLFSLTLWRTIIIKCLNGPSIYVSHRKKVP
jgi:hypothetical protein